MPHACFSYGSSSLSAIAVSYPADHRHSGSRLSLESRRFLWSFVSRLVIEVDRCLSCSHASEKVSFSRDECGEVIVVLDLFSRSANRADGCRSAT